MSAAAPTATAGAAPPAKKGKKKLIIIILAVVLLAAAGAGAMIVMKKKAAAAAEAADEPAVAEHGGDGKPDLKHPPTFLPLDPFVVNLADKEVDRYAQIGITLEVSDAHFAEEMKAFMPAIRNGILMILAHKTSKELLERAGKEQLASEILREASRTMGIEVEDPEEADAADDDAKPKSKAAAKKKKKKKAVEPNPIKHVHFANFIVQ